MYNCSGADLSSSDNLTGLHGGPQCKSLPDGDKGRFDKHPTQLDAKILATASVHTAGEAFKSDIGEGPVHGLVHTGIPAAVPVAVSVVL